MASEPKKRLNLWFTWNYERQQVYLDKLSEQGVHLVKPGLFRGVFDTNPDVRYTYRIDYQPDVRRTKQMDNYLSLYQDTGWELVGECQGWYHFRRLWAPSEAQSELYTDTDSLRQHYRRIQRVLLIVFLAEFIMLVVNLNNFAMLGDNHEHLSYLYIPLYVLLAAVMVLLAYGCLALQKKMNRLPKS